jgi:hypothetical protein
MNCTFSIPRDCGPSGIEYPNSTGEDGGQWRPHLAINLETLIGNLNVVVYGIPSMHRDHIDWAFFFVLIRYSRCPATENTPYRYVLCMEECRSCRLMYSVVLGPLEEDQLTIEHKVRMPRCNRIARDVNKDVVPNRCESVGCRCSW